jgi:hypothetical protein
VFVFRFSTGKHVSYKGIHQLYLHAAASLLCSAAAINSRQTLAQTEISHHLLQPAYALWANRSCRSCWWCLAGDFMRDFSLKLVPLLEDKIRVMIYAGVHSRMQAHTHVAACAVQQPRHFFAVVFAVLCACGLHGSCMPSGGEEAHGPAAQPV